MKRSPFEHLRRLVNARRLGVSFGRRSTFRMPAKIRLGGREVAITAPEEQGARCDFVTCFLSDEYALGKIRFPVATIADIGANVGFFSMAASARFPAAKIHAYEPNPRVHPFLRANLGAVNVPMYPEAVGARAGWVQIHDTAESNAASTVPVSGEGNGVPQVALGEVIARLGGRVDLVKMDCEGAEWEMFTEPAPWQQIGEVRMEYHLSGGRTFADVRAALSGLGFEIHHHRPEDGMGTVFAKNRAG